MKMTTIVLNETERAHLYLVCAILTGTEQLEVSTLTVLFGTHSITATGLLINSESEHE